MPVNTRHPDADAMLKRWTLIRDVLAGPAVVKSKKTDYLPRLPGQRLYSLEGVFIDEYLNYLERAVLVPFGSRVLNGLTGLVCRKAPIFTVPDEIKPMLVDITLEGETAEGFAKNCLRENLSVSFGGILVDWSGDQTGRPYMRLYEAESVTAWDFAVLDGRSLPRRIVLREFVREANPNDPFVDNSVEQYRVVELVGGPAIDYPLGYLQHQLYRQVKDAKGVTKPEWIKYGEPIVPLRLAKPLSFIPFKGLNPFGAVLRVVKPQILDLIDLILAHFKNSADYENLLHFAGAGQLLHLAGHDPNKDVRVGGSSAVITDNPAAHASYVTTGGHGGAELRQALEDKKVEMSVAAARLLLAEQKRGVETVASHELRMAGDDATLQDVAGSTAMTIEEALKIFVWWAGAADTVEEINGLRDAKGKTIKTVSVELNSQFFSTLISADDVVRLGVELEQRHISFDTYWYNLTQGERTMEGRTKEEEMAAIKSDKAFFDGIDPTPLPPPMPGIPVNKPAGQPGNQPGNQPADQPGNNPADNPTQIGVGAA